jgi:hypothetical protein
MSSTIPGTGSAISFGVQSLAGTYWVLAENTTTHCINRMFDCVYISINPLLPVSLTINPSANPVNTGAAVTFTANPLNEGPAPVYQWKVNGLNAGTNQPTFTYIPVNGDEVKCILVSNLPCASGNPASSNTVEMMVNGVPVNSNANGIVVNGHAKCFNALQTLVVAGGGTSFIVQNGGSATMVAGHNIVYLPGTSVLPGGYMHGYITTANQYCGQQAPSLPTVVAGENDPTVSIQTQRFVVYPNPTTGNFTLEQKGDHSREDVKVEIYGMRGERVLTGEMPGERKHEFSISGFAPGLYFVKVVSGDSMETIKLIKTQ